MNTHHVLGKIVGSNWVVAKLVHSLLCTGPRQDDTTTTSEKQEHLLFAISNSESHDDLIFDLRRRNRSELQHVPYFKLSNEYVVSTIQR
jgi:hypothetical protein